MELDLTLPTFTRLATALLVDGDEDIVYVLRMPTVNPGLTNSGTGRLAPRTGAGMGRDEALGEPQ